VGRRVERVGVLDEQQTEARETAKPCATPSLCARRTETRSEDEGGGQEHVDRGAGWEAGTKVGFDTNLSRSVRDGKGDSYLSAYAGYSREPSGETRLDWIFAAVAEGTVYARLDDLDSARSEERRVGKECRRLCRSRWSPYH
jgi:hypothetical protein